MPSQHIGIVVDLGSVTFPFSEYILFTLYLAPRICTKYLKNICVKFYIIINIFKIYYRLNTTSSHEPLELPTPPNIEYNHIKFKSWPLSLTSR